MIRTYSLGARLREKQYKLVGGEQEKKLNWKERGKDKEVIAKQDE